MRQQQKNKKRYLFILLGFYIAVLIYFMFFGFGRPQLAEFREYRYSLIPVRIPLWLPNHFSIDIIKLWIFALGNLLAFIPFGILVPMVFENPFKTYFKFIVFFVFFILCMEIVQMVTYLGSFDIEDIIVNTMGATIGFCTYKVSERMNTLRKNLVSIGLSIVGLILLMFLIAWVFNNTITPYILKIHSNFY
ncbi:VanZ family protein [Halobacillus litoralis]|uniref:VanZ family protein n=1 Tax=Halobacillus litoralis TaxID=45668 RepID=UPI0024902EAA|nr:VanZ family protein [Halobacillus litoralis]